MTRLRDLGYDPLLISYLVGPLTGLTPEKVRTALRDVLSSPRGRPLLRLRTRAKGWRRVDRATALAAVDRAVEVVADGPLERADLIGRLLAEGFAPGRLPIRLLVDGPVLGFCLPHGLFDGTGATEAIRLVVEKLGAPGPDEEPERPRPARPLLDLMRRFELTGLAGVRTARDTFRSMTAETETGYQLERTLSKAESVERTRIVSAVLTAETLRSIAATPEQARDGRRPARPPLSLKTASVVLRCLRDSSRDGMDLRVVIPVDARRWLPKGQDVDGNFSPSLPMGRLLTDDLSATALAERIASATKTGLPVTWLFASLLISVKNTVRHPLSALRTPKETPRVPFEVHVSLPTGEVAVSEELLPRIEPDTIIGGAPTHLHLPLGVWVELAPMRDCLHLIVQDETGAFDLDGFEERLLAAVESAAAAERS
ncbi:hypothetical protein [Rathayibacter sp. VKM Ac-2760]|uniref:hypothetical protein n=1 Tax=Rathayibacter sp. VKM Ac-2760 TaxID=2609253 RepID=UPI001317CBAA|nr:hypothetical protein [Rathayibacter sp. VKM Ac-2760]QHC57216.1 hypothetical protein GSU72_00440 [Rathayibacter sp. VKM Ac-2760]